MQRLKLIKIGLFSGEQGAEALGYHQEFYHKTFKEVAQRNFSGRDCPA